MAGVAIITPIRRGKGSASDAACFLGISAESRRSETAGSTTSGDMRPHPSYGWDAATDVSEQRDREDSRADQHELPHRPALEAAVVEIWNKVRHRDVQ